MGIMYPLDLRWRVGDVAPPIGTVDYPPEYRWRPGTASGQGQNPNPTDLYWRPGDTSGSAIQAPQVWQNNKVFGYNAFATPFSSGQGSLGNAGTSNLDPLDPQRLAAVDALVAAGIRDFSYSHGWENIEPFPPVGGVHSYDWSVVDFSIADMVRTGGQSLQRVNAGNANSAANWMDGGGTARQTVDLPIGGSLNHLFLPGGDAKLLPLIGSTVSLNGRGTFGALCKQEVFTVTNVVVGTGDITLSGNVQNSHLAGGIVEWTKLPVDWTPATRYVAGDIVYAPAGTTINGEAKDFICYVYTQNVASSAATFLPLDPSLVELVQMRDGQIMPRYDDPVFQANRIAFIQAFAARYNGHPKVALVSMVGAGFIGEFGLNSQSTDFQTVAAWYPHGHNDWRYSNAWMTFINAYMQSWTATLLDIHIGEPFGQSFVQPTTRTMVVTYAAASPFITATFIGDEDGAIISDVNLPKNLYLFMSSTTLSVASGVGAATATLTVNALSNALLNGAVLAMADANGNNPTTVTINQVGGYAKGFTGVINITAHDFSAHNYAIGATLVDTTRASISRSPVLLDTNTVAGADTLRPLGAGVALQLGTTKLTGTACTATIGQSDVLCPAITLAHQGMKVTGITGIGTAFVGTVTVGVKFRLSSTRIGQTDGPVPTAGSATCTLAFDGLLYNGKGQLVPQVIGSNVGGALASDVYSGGTPFAALGAPATGLGLDNAWPLRAFLAQNGLTFTDLNSLPLGRFRQLISGSSPLAPGTPPPNEILRYLSGGYQAVGGGNTAPQIQQMLQVAFDDRAKYVELYANDCRLAGANVFTAAYISGVRP